MMNAGFLLVIGSTRKMQLNELITSKIVCGKNLHFEKRHYLYDER